MDMIFTCILSYISLFFNKKEADSMGISHRIGLIVMQPVSPLR